MDAHDASQNRHVVAYSNRPELQFTLYHYRFSTGALEVNDADPRPMPQPGLRQDLFGRRDTAWWDGQVQALWAEFQVWCVGP